jgi:hypothetical protein
MDRCMSLYYHLSYVGAYSENQVFVKSRVNDLKEKTLRLGENIRNQEKIAYDFSHNLKDKTSDEIEEYIKKNTNLTK